MFETTGDILNLVLAVGIGAVVIFLCIALFYAIFVLRDISSTTKVLRKTANKVDHILVQPVKLANFLFSKVKDIAEIVEKNIAKKSRNK